MRVGFLNNQIDNRGTGNALFDYADYNEKILGNESIIFTFNESESNELMEYRLIDRFGSVNSFGRNWPKIPLGVDVLYHIKSGKDDGFRPLEGTKYAVHAVFDYEPHGDKYAVVSPWLSHIHSSPFVPHIVSLPEIAGDLRSDMGIAENDIVFGRHGGSDSFDIVWAWNSINRALKARPDVWFLFMNTDLPDIELYDPNRVVLVSPTANPYQKSLFINTCDAMLHARARGETFGIAVGEFARAGKPVLTYAFSPERNHLEEVACYTYRDEEELFLFLSDTEWIKTDDSYYNFGYQDYTPKNVMAKFKEVFLD